MMKAKIKSILQWIRFCLIAVGINKKDDRFQKDLMRWKKIHDFKCGNNFAIAKLLWEKKEFRNLFIYRNRNRITYRTWVTIIYPPVASLYIETPDIGGGLYIQHGFSTMIAAKSIGENCWINQQVTIGYSNTGEPPVIGNNVMITCGAKVLGNIIIEDNAVIGANAVVVKDVKKGAVMVGIPAHPLEKNKTV